MRTLSTIASATRARAKLLHRQKACGSPERILMVLWSGSSYCVRWFIKALSHIPKSPRFGASYSRFLAKFISV